MTTTTQATFSARNHITLSSGFHAQAGSEFQAIIEDCTAFFQSDTRDLAKQYLPQKPDLINAQTIKSPVITVYPNPFSNQFTLNYSLPTTGTTSIYLTNILGEKLWVLNAQIQEKGHHQITVSTADLVAGTYFIVLNNGDMTTARQLIRL